MAVRSGLMLKALVHRNQPFSWVGEGAQETQLSDQTGMGRAGTQIGVKDIRNTGVGTSEPP